MIVSSKIIRRVLQFVGNAFISVFALNQLGWYGFGISIPVCFGWYGLLVYLEATHFLPKLVHIPSFLTEKHSKPVALSNQLSFKMSTATDELLSSINMEQMILENKNDNRTGSKQRVEAMIEKMRDHCCLEVFSEVAAVHLVLQLTVRDGSTISSIHKNGIASIYNSLLAIILNGEIVDMWGETDKTSRILHAIKEGLPVEIDCLLN
jgi:hypothetical protein